MFSLIIMVCIVNIYNWSMVFFFSLCTPTAYLPVDEKTKQKEEETRRAVKRKEVQKYRITMRSHAHTYPLYTDTGMVMYFTNIYPQTHNIPTYYILVRIDGVRISYVCAKSHITIITENTRKRVQC